MQRERLLSEATRVSQGLLSAAQLRQEGVSRSRVSRWVAAGMLVRVRSRVYAVRPLDPLPRFVVTDKGVAPAYVAQVRAVLLSLGATAAACGRTAAALYGWGMLVEPARTIEVAVPHGRGAVARAGVAARQRRRAATQRLAIFPGSARLRVTTTVQTVIDCALALPLLQAVVICDSALRGGQVTVEELVRAAGRLAGVRDARAVRRVLDLCDPECGSVLESVLRVAMRLAGLDGFGTQTVIVNAEGVHIRVDFCFEQLGLVIEVDGKRWHQDPVRDRQRDNALAALGWRVLRYTWAEVMHERERVLAEITAAVGCATPTLHLGQDLAEYAA